jgi:hypothetical protein
MAGTIHPKEVTMRSPKLTLLVLALAAIVLTAWAGDNVDSDSPRSNNENKSAGIQAQPAKENDKPDQATQSKPRDEQAPRSEDKGVRAPERRSDNAQPARTQPDAVQTPRSKPEVNQAPTAEQPDRNYTEPARIQTRQDDRGSSDAGETNIQRGGGEPNRGRRGGDGSGGYQGGGRYDPFDRRPTHYLGGRGWHGRHDEWRHNRFHGSWRFLFSLGPVIYFPPIHYPHVIRLPHDRVGIYVRYTGEDAVGAEFANSVREHLRERGLRVVYSQNDARLELYVISMEQDPDDPGYGSSISVSYVWYPGHRFITAQMVDAGLNEVDDLAESVAAYADDLADDYR